MKTCNVELISALVDNELPENDAARLLEHIKTCPSCQTLFAHFTSIKEGISGLDVPPPDTLAPGIMYKIGLGDETSRPARIIIRLLAIAACVVAVIILTPNNFSPFGPQDEALDEEAGEFYTWGDSVPAEIAPASGIVEPFEFRGSISSHFEPQTFADTGGRDGRALPAESEVPEVFALCECEEDEYCEYCEDDLEG